MKKLIIVLLLCFASFASNAQYLIGSTRDSLYNDYKATPGVDILNLIDTNNHDTTVIVTTHPFALVAHFDKETHLCDKYTMIILRKELHEIYDSLLNETFTWKGPDKWVTKRGVEIEYLGYGGYNLGDEVMFKGYVYKYELGIEYYLNQLEKK